MREITIFPLFISTFFKQLPSIFRGRHQLLFNWFIVLIALGVGDYKLTNMAMHASRYITEWRLRRLLSAKYWILRSLFTWLTTEVIKIFPVPDDKTIYLMGDGSKKEKRSKKNPYIQKGKIRTNAAWFFGIRFCVLMVSWGNFRIPVDFEILYPKKHKKYRNENKLFRDMLKRFIPPVWAQRVIVLGDTAYASNDNMKYIKDRARKDWKILKIQWYFVFAMAKTCRFADGRSLKDLTKHLKRNCYQKNFISSLTSNRNLCYWTFSKRVELRHLGDVTIVLSKKRRNLGPKAIKVIVTNLPNVSVKTVLKIYQRRFMIEVLFRELKSGMGLGKQQVTKNEERITKSIGCSILAYLFLLKIQCHDIPLNQSWSIFGLRENFRYRVMQNQFKNDYKLIEKRMKKAA